MEYRPLVLRPRSIKQTNKSFDIRVIFKKGLIYVHELRIFAPKLCLHYCSSTVKENFQQKVSRIVLLCQAHCYSSSSSEILYNFSILLMTVPSTSSKSLASELPNSILVTQGRGKSKFVSIPWSILPFNILRHLTLSGPAFFRVSHGPGGANFSPPPWYLSPEASE